MLGDGTSAKPPDGTSSTHADCAATQDPDAEQTLGDCSGVKPPDGTGSMQEDGSAAPGCASKAAAAVPPPSWEDGTTAAGKPDAN